PALVRRIHGLERVGRGLASKGDELGVGGRRRRLIWAVSGARPLLTERGEKREGSGGRSHLGSLTFGRAKQQRSKLTGGSSGREDRRVPRCEWRDRPFGSPPSRSGSRTARPPVGSR